MNIIFISPRLPIQKGDILGSGIPYWPQELVTLATISKSIGDGVKVLDLLSENIRNFEDYPEYYLQGEPLKKTLKDKKININNFQIIILFAISFMTHNEIIELSSELRKTNKKIKILILENSQAVTGYDLFEKSEEFFNNGVDALLCGDIFNQWQIIREEIISNKISNAGIVSKNNPTKIPVRHIDEISKIPLPNWELINYKAYWKLPYSHGPKQNRYLPLLTSRGCSFPCDFCVIPSTNNQKWRAKTPEQVVKEIITLKNKYGIDNFHIEDLNPTLSKSRWIKISNILINENVQIKYFLVSGTKAETVPIESIKTLYKSGCRYISISPESGDKNVLNNIGKPFNYKYCLNLIKACRNTGIMTQACFIIGHPAETQTSHIKTKSFLKQLLKAGLSEPAFFIVSPFPGSIISKKKLLNNNWGKFLPSFSPKSRSDFVKLQEIRKSLICLYFLHLFSKPILLTLIIIRTIGLTPLTKSENLFKRLLFLGFWINFSKVKNML